MVSFNASTFSIPTVIPDVLAQYAGPVGQEGSGAELHARFGNWRKCAFTGVYVMHDRCSTGFSFRSENDIALYEDIEFDVFKKGFMDKDPDALTILHANAIYFDMKKTSKYLGIDMLRMLDRE